MFEKSGDNSAMSIAQGPRPGEYDYPVAEASGGRGHGAGYTCEAIASVASSGCRPSVWERTDKICSGCSREYRLSSSVDQSLKSSVTGPISQYRKRPIAVKINATPPPHTPLIADSTMGLPYSINPEAVYKIWTAAISWSVRSLV